MADATELQVLIRIARESSALVTVARLVLVSTRLAAKRTRARSFEALPRGACRKTLHRPPKADALGRKAAPHCGGLKAARTRTDRCAERCRRPSQEELE